MHELPSASSEASLSQTQAQSIIQKSEPPPIAPKPRNIAKQVNKIIVTSEWQHDPVVWLNYQFNHHDLVSIF